MRFARNKDASHRAVVAAFKAQGCSVLVIDCSAANAWDLEVGFLGKDHGVEVKPTVAQAKANKRIDAAFLRPSQAAFFAKWKGAPTQLVRSPEDVAQLCQLWRLEASNADRAAQLLAKELKETHDRLLAEVNR